MVLPERLRNKPAKVGVVFSIDRDGKLLTVTVDQSSGSPEDDAATLAALRRIKSFPRVPDELQVPYKIWTTVDYSAAAGTGHGGAIAYVDLKWPPMTSTTSGQEIAYRTELQNHLRLFPLILPESMKRPNDVHSVLAFSIDRDGKLIEVKVAKSFGIKAVDDQTLAWVKAIQPFSKMPSELNAPLKLTAEIVFGPKSIWNDEEARRKVNGVCRGC
jgi:periplasmic protein TonB